MQCGMSLKLLFLFLPTLLPHVAALVSVTSRLHPIQELMTGRYNNAQQASRDAQSGRPTAAQGGHEFVTASILQHPNKALPNVLLAQYYLGTDSARTFRLRCYEFCESSDDSSVRMRIYRPSPDTEQVFKSAKYSLTHPTVRELPSFSLPFGGQLRKLAVADLVQRDFDYLSGCDVQWNYHRPRIPFTSIPLPRPFPRYFRGVLVEGTCTVCSQKDPSVTLVARDELRLSQRRLDINDRVYTLDGKLVIGSTSGDPYRMERLDETLSRI